jgi:hypothetical protein
MNWLAIWWWLILIPVVPVGIWMLARRWRHPQPVRKGTALAFMYYQALFEPAVEHVIEYQQSGDLILQTNSEPEPEPPSDH